MKIIWSPLAIDRASEIAEYIAQDKPSAAENWIDTVFSKIEQLKYSPEISRFVPEIKNNQFRELIYGNYRIIPTTTFNSTLKVHVHAGDGVIERRDGFYFVSRQLFL